MFILERGILAWGIIMAIEVDENGGQYVIKITGRFELSNHMDFVKAYESIAGNTAVLDLGEAVYLDSAALGMMLAMRERIAHEIWVVHGESNHGRNEDLKSLPTVRRRL